MTNYGSFLNEFAANLILALAVFAVMGLPTFGFFYNRFIDKRSDRNEHTSLYVAGGVMVTLLVGGLFSWKAMLLYAVLFFLSGFLMIAGEFERTTRRKRYPYAATGRINDAYDNTKEALRLVALAMKNNGRNVETALPLAAATTEINKALILLNEVKNIQLLEE